MVDVCSLRQSCQQAEDALSQGMDKLQQTLAETIVAGQLVEATYIPHMATAMEKLEALVSFVNQVILYFPKILTYICFSVNVLSKKK